LGDALLTDNGSKTKMRARGDEPRLASDEPKRSSIDLSKCDIVETRSLRESHTLKSEGRGEMNRETNRLDGQANDEASAPNDRASPRKPTSAIERKRPASGAVPAATRPTPKTKVGASAPKRKKPFVL